MSLIVERVRKAIERYGRLDLETVAKEAGDKAPLQLASADDLGARHRFLLQTSGSVEQAELAYERIIHGNELQDINYLTRGVRATRAICRVWIRGEGGRLEGYGTGFLISGRVLITNNHVLGSALAAGRSEAEFEYERDESGMILPGVKFPLDPESLFFTHEGLDFSVVAVGPRAVNAERQLAEFGHLPLIGGTGKAAEGEWLTIVQHPGGEPKQLCARENQLLRKGPDVLWYSTDTLGGSSGSPVFNNDWLVVALHHSGVPEIKGERWQTVDGQDYDPRVHREEDIKWIANEGIRVSRIVETLHAEVGTHPLVAAALQAGPAEILVRPSLQTFNPTIPVNPHTPLPVSASLAGRQYLVSFDAAGNPSMTPFAGSAATEAAVFAERTAAAVPRARGVAFRFDQDYSNRNGYDEDFLKGAGAVAAHRVHLPTLSPALAARTVKLLEPAGTEDHVLKYMNYSVVMHDKRRFAIYSAANVDFGNRFAITTNRTWREDPRIPLEMQVGEDAYAGNQFDLGHLSRQEDLEYGADLVTARQSAADSCHLTNAVLQHAKFNRNKTWWQGLEQHILEKSITAKTKGFRAQVFTGPVFAANDPEYPEIPDVKVPMKFWKVCAAVSSAGRLFAVAYLMDQSPAIRRFGVSEAAGATPFEPYKLFQLPISELEGMIHLRFTCGAGRKPLSDFDPLKDGVPPELDSDNDGLDDRHESAGIRSATPPGWLDMLRHRPYLG